MGRQGEFVVKYDVKVQELQNELGKASKLLRQHKNEINSAQAISPNLTSKQISDTKVATESLNAQTASTRVLMTTQGRWASRLKRLGVTNKNVAADIGQLESSIKRLAAFWASAGLIFGALKLAKSVSDLAGSYQFVVRTLTVLGNEGEAVYNRLATAAFEAAAATGRTFTEAAEAMKAWVRQGFSALEIADLTRTTLIGLNLTELSSIQLVRTLTAQMKAFNIPAAESITILDKLVGVSRKYAIETTQLAIGMRRFAAVSNEAGISLDQQAGLMTAMMVRTQQAAQMVGRAGRTILVRLRRNAIEALEEIAKVNVFTDDSRQSFRNLFDVLEDVAGVWGTLTDAQRANIAFQAAGLRQQEFFIALMEDFNIAQEAQIVSLSSAGLAYKSNRQLVDTFQKSLAALKTEWEKLLSLQSGILDFLQSLVNGLRSMINLAISLPGGFIELGLAITAFGGAVLAVTVSPLVGGLLALASAAALFVTAIGKGATPALAELAQLARETAQARLAEARNTEELARLYVKYFDQLQKGEDVEEKLTKARKGLIDINPDLVSGAQTLQETYDVLTGSVDAMALATDVAEKSFRGLSAAMLERSIVESKQAISDLIPEFQKIGSGIDPDDVERVRALGKSLRNDVGDEWTRIINIQTHFARTGEIAFDRLINQTGVYSGALSELEQAEENLRKARDLDISARNPDGSISTVIPLKLPAAMQEYIRIATKANLVTNEQSLTAENLTRHFDALANAQKRLTDFFSSAGEGKGVVIEDVVIEADKKQFLKDIEKQLDIQAKIAEIADKQSRLRAGGVKDLESEANLARQIFDDSIQTLSVLAETADTASERAAAGELLAKFGAEEEKVLDLILIILDSQLRIQEDRLRVEQQIIKEGQRGREIAAKEEARLASLRQKNADQLRDLAIQSRVDATKLSEGELAAARQLFQEKIKIFNDEKARLAELRQGGINERSPLIQAQRQRVGEAELAVQAAAIAKNNQETEAGIDLQNKQDELAQARVQNEADLLTAKGETIAALEKEIAILENNLTTARAIGTNAEQTANAIDAQIALEAKQNELTAARLALAEDVAKTEDSIVQAKFDGFVAATRARDGDIAASRVVLLLQKAQLLALQFFNTDQDKAVQIAEKRREIQETTNDINQKGIDNTIDLEAELKNLEEERQESELQHRIRMLELDGNIQAGFDIELAFWATKLAAAREETDLVKRQIETKKAQNNIDATNAARRVHDRAKELEFQEQLIRFAGQQLSAAISGDFGAGGVITGLAGLATSAIEGPLGVAVSVGAGVLAALFEGPAEDLSDSLDTNTQAIDRNTQTLQDVFEQRIGVPTSFTLPAAIAMQGALRGGVGGGATVNQNSITIAIDGRGQDANQIANRVETILTRRLNVDSRRGFGSNIFALG